MATNFWSLIQNISKLRFWTGKNKFISQPNKLYLYAKGPYQAKYQFLINKREGAGLPRWNDSKAFTECSNDMGNIYKCIEENNPNKERKILIAFDDILLLKWLVQ